MAKKKSKKVMKRPPYGGRPPKIELSPEMVNNIAAAIQMGMYIEVAAALNDVSRESLRKWMKLGAERPNTVYGNFYRAIRKALAFMEASGVKNIQNHIGGRPIEYAQAAQIDAAGNPIMGPDGKPIMILQLDANGNPIKIRDEIKSDWKAAAWLLERRGPKRWGRIMSFGDLSDELSYLDDLASPDENEQANGQNITKENHEEESDDVIDVAPIRSKTLKEVKELVYILENTDEEPQNEKLGKIEKIGEK